VATKRDKALHAAVEAHREPLTKVVRSLLRDQVEVDDVIQETFEEFVEAYDLGLQIERLGAWLVTVAKNKVLDRFRRAKTRTEHEEEVKVDESTRQAEQATPASRWAQTWLREEILDALDALPAAQRAVFVAHELEGKSFKAIQAETGVPLGTLLARKKYAVDALRDHLQEIYDDLE
jgi:RNA polymerase sigma factor (sigma-70 family)